MAILPIVEATAQNTTALATLGFANRSLMCGATEIPIIDAIGMRL